MATLRYLFFFFIILLVRLSITLVNRYDFSLFKARFSCKFEEIDTFVYSLIKQN